MDSLVPSGYHKVGWGRLSDVLQALPLAHGFHAANDHGVCGFRPLSHACMDIQARCHGISATPSRNGATVVRGAVTPLRPVNPGASHLSTVLSQAHLDLSSQHLWQDSTYFRILLANIYSFAMIFAKGGCR